MKQEKMINAKKDELRAGNQCFHCTKPGHFAKDCPTKKIIHPSAGTIPLPEPNSLHNTVNQISLFSMAPRCNESSESECEGAATSLNSRKTYHSPTKHLTHDKHCSELVKDPYKMKREDTQRVSIFAHRVCQCLNQSVLKLEEMLHKRRGFQGEMQDRGSFKRHGHSMVIMNMWTGRGIEVQTDAPRPIEEIVKLIRQ